MFTEEELANFYQIVQNTSEFVEIGCGCTHPRYGDTCGKLRAYVDGRLEIDCTCRDDCNKVNMPPVEFARHAGRTNAHTNWKSQIWVFSNDGHKTALWKTCLLKHHTHTFLRPLRQVVHRDEFKTCNQCHKERRFNLKSREACKVYHDALLNDSWKCSDMPDNALSCNDVEERECRKVSRGCPRDLRCVGCEQCVCFGCDMCRFETCNCRTCVEFIMNL